MFIRRLDGIQTGKENKANRTRRPIENPVYTDATQELRWSRFKALGSTDEMFVLVRDKLFPWLRESNDVIVVLFWRHKIYIVRCAIVRRA